MATQFRTLTSILIATNAIAASSSFPLVNALVDTPIVQRCPGLENVSTVACVNDYAAVLPYPFIRASASDGADPANDTFVDTSVPSDPSFSRLLTDTPFIIFDQARGLRIVGAETKLERIFDTRNDSIHEAPVYVGGLNAIIFSLPHQGKFVG